MPYKRDKNRRVCTKSIDLDLGLCEGVVLSQGGASVPINTVLGSRAEHSSTMWHTGRTWHAPRLVDTSEIERFDWHTLPQHLNRSGLSRDNELDSGVPFFTV